MHHNQSPPCCSERKLWCIVRMAATEVDIAATTLASAISAFPELGQICSTALDRDTPSSGLKIMRMVSKDMRTAMLGVVQGYEMTLDGRAADLLAEIIFLQGTSLSQLIVGVTGRPNGELDESLRIIIASEGCTYESSQVVTWIGKTCYCFTTVRC